MIRFALAPCVLWIWCACASASVRAEESPEDIQRTTSMIYRLEADGRYTVEQRFDIIAGTTSAARQIAEQSFGWSADLENANLVEAYTRKEDGSIRPLQRNVVLKQALGAGSDAPSFSDWQVRSLVFPDVQPGDTVHYVVQRQAMEALFPGRFQTALELGSGAQQEQVEIELDLPASMKLRIAQQGLTEDPARRASAGLFSQARVMRHWHLATDGSGKDIRFTASSFDDYAQLGAAYAARARAKAEPDAAVRAMAHDLVKDLPQSMPLGGMDALAVPLAVPQAVPLTVQRAQARVLYDYVATHIRYVGLQLGAGRIVPRAASEVLNTGYGDCKDHVTLLQALLLSVGVESEPVLIGSKSRYDLPQPPTLEVLDHVILYVPQLDAWLDPTSGYAPFGVLPIAEYGKPAIVAGVHGARVTNVAALPARASWARVETDLDVTEYGQISGHTVTSAGGPYAVALREIAEDLGTVGDQLHRLGTPGSGVYTYDPPAASLVDRYSVAADFELEDGAQDATDQRLAPPSGVTVMVRPGGFLVSQTAVPGGHVCYAGQQQEVIRMHLGDALMASDMPRDVVVNGGFAHYTATWRQDGHDVVVTRAFSVETPHPVCSEAEYRSMKPVLRAARLDLHARMKIQPALDVAEKRTEVRVADVHLPDEEPAHATDAMAMFPALQLGPVQSSLGQSSLVQSSPEASSVALPPAAAVLTATTRSSAKR